MPDCESLPFTSASVVSSVSIYQQVCLDQTACLDEEIQVWPASEEKKPSWLRKLLAASHGRPSLPPLGLPLAHESGSDESWGYRRWRRHTGSIGESRRCVSSLSCFLQTSKPLSLPASSTSQASRFPFQDDLIPRFPPASLPFSAFALSSAHSHETTRNSARKRYHATTGNDRLRSEERRVG